MFSAFPSRVYPTTNFQNIILHYSNRSRERSWEFRGPTRLMTWLQGSLRRGRLCRVESQGTDRSAARAIARLPGARATGCLHAPALRWDGCAAGAAAGAGDACAGCSGASARSCARGRRAPASWCAVLARAASGPWCDRPRRLGSRASSSNPDSHRTPPRSPPGATRRVAVAALEAGQWERPAPSRRVARPGGCARFWRATPRASIGVAGEGVEPRDDVTELGCSLAWGLCAARSPGNHDLFLHPVLCTPSGRGAEEAMAPHSSTLAWKIPWTEEPGRMQSMGSLRVGHDWATSLSLFTFMHWRRKWQPTPVFLPRESQGWRSLVGCRLWGRTESDMTEVT